MSYSVDMNRVFEDSEGIYFFKIDSSHKQEKIRCSEMGYLKEMTMKIFIEKVIQNSENLENEVTVFEQVLTVTIPDEKRFKYLYLYKTKSGIIHQKDFESGSCSAVNVNDPELVKRSRAKKLPENSFLLKSAPIFTIRDGVYERRLSTE